MVSGAWTVRDGCGAGPVRAQARRGRARSQRAVGDRTRAAAERDHAGLDELPDAERLEHAQQRLELVAAAGGLDGDGVRSRRRRPWRGTAATVSSTCSGSARSALHLDEQQLALHRGVGLELDDLEHLDQLVELLGDLLERQLVLDVDHDGHPRDPGVLGRPDRERLDVEAAAGEQRRRPGPAHRACSRRARTACGVLMLSSSPSQPGARSRATLMSSLLVPAATIGHTMASLCTTKSTTTGASLIDIAFSIVASTSLRALAPQPDAAERLGELHEVRDRASARVQVGVGVAALVEQRLPLPHHAEALLLMTATLIGMSLSAQVTSSWLVIWKQPSPSIAQTVASGPADLGAHRGGHGVAHGAERRRS